MGLFQNTVPGGDERREDGDGLPIESLVMSIKETQKRERKQKQGKDRTESDNPIKPI